MKKRYWFILIVLLILGVFSNNALASNVIFSKEYESHTDIEGNIYSIGDFSVDNEKLYILDKNKEEVEIVFTNGNSEIIKLNEDGKFPGSSMISVDSGVIYVLNISLRQIRQIIPKERDIIYPIDLDTEAISKFKVINGNPYITLHSAEDEETRVYRNENEKYILDETLLGSYIGKYSYEFLRDSENIFNNFGGTYTITNRDRNYTYEIKIKSDNPLFGSKIIGYTNEGNFIIENNEENNIKKIQLINQNGDVLLEQETFNSLEIFKTSEYENGNLYFLNNKDKKVSFYKNKWSNPRVEFYIYINGKIANAEDSFIKDDRILVPLRYISEELGFKVDYKKETREIKITNDETTVKMNVESSKYTVNGDEKTMDTSPILKDGTTYVPIRFVSESLGEKVVWDEKNFNALIGEFEFNGDRENKVKVEYPQIGLSMYVPEEFDQQILTYFQADDDRYGFVDRKNNIEYAYGHLGTIMKEEFPSTNFVPGYILKYEGGIYTTINFPSDVQFKLDDKEFEKVYMDSFELLKEAVRTIEFN